MMKIKNNVVCCGKVAFDLIENAVDRENRLVFQARPGGSVLNTSIQLARLGMKVKLLSRTGKDFLGDRLVKNIRDNNIDSRYVYQDNEIKTGLALARINKKGNSSYSFYKTKGKQTSFKKGELPSSLFNDAFSFHTASMYAYEDYSHVDALRLIKLAKEKNLFTTFDPNWRADRIKNKPLARKRIKKLIDYTRLLKLSDADALGLTGEKTLQSALRFLPGRTIVTLGEKGSLFWNGKTKLIQKAFKVKVSDTIGAGDGFTAGLLLRYHLLGEENFWHAMKENLNFASAVSAIVCTGRGATEKLKSLNQVYKFLSKTQSEQ